MSAHFDKYGLNTYYATDYFHAHIPADYPLSRVLQKSRAFRRLPPRLRELSALAKRWAYQVRPFPAVIGGIERWYDDDGYELNPATGQRLTDEEIDAQWREPNPELAAFVVEDIPLPAGGFADPDTWEPTPVPEEIDIVDRGLTMDGVLSDIASRGRERTAAEYAAPADWRTRVTSDEDLARIILDMEGKPWPARE
jgi:hypothetical protein